MNTAKSVDSVEQPAYWICSASNVGGETAVSIIQRLVRDHGMYGFSKGIGRNIKIKPNDYICFYASKVGIVAHARVASKPQHNQHAALPKGGGFPWIISLTSQALYVDNPVEITEELRKQLDAYKTNDPVHNWQWLVLRPRKLSRHDYEMLTRSVS